MNTIKSETAAIATQPAQKPESNDLFQTFPRFLFQGESYDIRVSLEGVLSLDEPAVDAFLFQRWAEFDKKSPTPRPTPLPITPKSSEPNDGTLFSRMTSVRASTASEIHAFYLDSKKYPSLYGDSELATLLAASSECLHPKTAALILGDVIKKIEAGSYTEIPRRTMASLVAKAEKAPNGSASFDRALMAGLGIDPNAVLALIRKNPDVKLPDPAVRSILFSIKSEVSGIDFSRQENIHLIDTENMVFVGCTFGPKITEAQQKTAAGFRNCSFINESGQTFEISEIPFLSSEQKPSSTTHSAQPPTMKGSAKGSKDQIAEK